MKPALPPLQLRTTRVRLLAATHTDALLARATDAHGTKDSRLNLPDTLWYEGSYPELDQASREAGRAFRTTYLDIPFAKQPAGIDDDLQLVANLMPRNIYVPIMFTLNAGYLEGEAGTYKMPHSEFERRRKCLPRRRSIA